MKRAILFSFFLVSLAMQAQTPIGPTVVAGWLGFRPVTVAKLQTIHPTVYPAYASVSDGANISACGSGTGGGSTYLVCVYNGSVWAPTGSGGGGSTNPGGSNTYVQVNASGVFGGFAAFTYTSGTGVLTVPTVTASTAVTAPSATFTNGNFTNITISGTCTGCTAFNSGAPPPIGNVTPNTGSFSTLTATTEAIVPDPANPTDAVNLETMQANGINTACGTTNAMALYPLANVTVACDPNVTETGSLLSSLVPFVATSASTNGAGAGQITYTCASPLQSASSVGIDFSAPTSCSHYRVIWPNAPGTINQQPVITGVSTTDLTFGWATNSAFYGWTVNIKSANYTILSSEFSSAAAQGNWFLIQGLTNATLQLPASAPPANSCVRLSNQGTGTMTVDPNGISVDGDATTFTITQFQWAEICSTGTNYKMVGLESRNTLAGTGTVTVVGAGNLNSTAIMTGGGSQTSQTPSATSTLSAGGNAVFAGTLSTSGAKLTVDANGIPTKVANLTTVGLGAMIPIYTAATTGSIPATTTGVIATITIDTPAADTWYEIPALQMAQTNTPASCTGTASVALQLDYTNADNSLHVTGINNVLWIAESSTSGAAIAPTVTFGANGAPTAANVFDLGSRTMLVHVKASTALKLILTIPTNTLASCSPFPAYTFTTVAFRVIN